MNQLDRIENMLTTLMERTAPKKKSKPSDPAKAALIASMFADWWTVWPLKTAKADALKAYTQLTRKMNHSQMNKFTDMIIGDTTGRIRQEESWLRGDGRFIPLPATYLRGKRFNDVITEVVEQEVKLPNDMVALEKIAVERGMHPKGQAPQQIRNIFEYRSWIQERL